MMRMPRSLIVKGGRLLLPSFFCLANVLVHSGFLDYFGGAACKVPQGAQ